LGTFDTNPAPGEPVIPINLATGPALFTANFHLSKTFGFGGEEHGHGGGGGGYHGHRHGLGGRGLSGGSGGGFWHHHENSKYNLTLGISVRNAFNIVNLGTPNGNLGSPLFGQSNSLVGRPFSTQSANRVIDFQARFNF
ncbi:MAG TPA: hypothetical protein VFZ08_06150, partial [Terriglobia bacterium]|nr:hypothetical protein [Terriglobia bacterium]